MNRSGPGIVGDPRRKGDGAILAVFEMQTLPTLTNCKEAPTYLEDRWKCFGAGWRGIAISGETICFSVEEE